MLLRLWVQELILWFADLIFQISSIWTFRFIFRLYTCRCLVAKLCLTLVTPWTIARQAPLSVGFSRQEYWSELPFPSPVDLPNLEIEPMSPTLVAMKNLTEPSGKALYPGRDNHTITKVSRKIPSQWCGLLFPHTSRSGNVKWNFKKCSI